MTHQRTTQSARGLPAAHAPASGHTRGMLLAALLATLLATLATMASPRPAQAFELVDGMYQSGIVFFPTALKQPVEHSFHVTSQVTDTVNPDMDLVNLRHGYQYGAFQLLTDLFYTVEPVREFNYAEMKGKLQILSLDEYRFYMAVGLLVRGVTDSAERKWRIDDRTSSFLGVMSVELFPFYDWGGVLTNLYLDNRYASLGMKIQIFEGIQGVFEMDRLHSSAWVQEKNHARGGLSFEQLENFYLQMLYDDRGKHFFLQLGVGF